MIEIANYNNGTQIRLSPNRSASWRQTKLLMYGFAFFVGSIACAWAFVGAWVILPFAGAEVFALGLIMYLVSKTTYEWEEIVVTPKKIVISTSKGATLTLERTDTYLEFVEDTSNRRLPRIILSTSQSRCEIGSFLNTEDRRALLNQLNKTGLVVCKNKWW